MPEGRQEYLPGFSPLEVDPGSLLITKRYGDYEVWFTKSGLAAATTNLARYTFKYPYFVRQVLIDQEVPYDQEPEWACVIPTRQSSHLWDPSLNKCKDLVFRREKFEDTGEEGTFIYIYAARLGQMLMGERDFVMDRYDGHSDKLWIRPHPIW